MTRALVPSTAGPSCPDCRAPLDAVPSGTVVARRCGRCRGIWLDPASFARLCDEEARPSGDAGTIVSASAGHPFPGRTPREEKVRYRACPACGEVMNRRNFAKVSGVVIDVCRPHGAWFDRGELGAIRAFLRSGGVERYARHRRNRELLAADRGGGGPRAGPASLDDVYDVLVGGDARWDVPSRVPRLLVAALFAAAGGWFLWMAYHPAQYSSRRLGLGPVLLGLVCFHFAWRAFGQWRASRQGPPADR